MSVPETGFGSGDAAPVFAALGDVRRLALVSRLMDGRSRSIVQLSDGLSLTRQGVTKHLRVLENAGIVSCERVGRESRYLLQPGTLNSARNYLERVAEQWDETLGRLKAYLEDG